MQRLAASWYLCKVGDIYIFLLFSPSLRHCSWLAPSVSEILNISFPIKNISWNIFLLLSHYQLRCQVFVFQHKRKYWKYFSVCFYNSPGEEGEEGRSLVMCVKYLISVYQDIIYKFLPVLTILTNPPPLVCFYSLAFNYRQLRSWLENGRNLYNPLVVLYMNCGTIFTYWSIFK